MPTYEWTARFRRDFESLTPAQRASFQRTVTRFVEDLRAGRFRKGLRVKAYRGEENLFELTWAPDGRALFSYATPVRPNQTHIVWHRVGSHAIFDNP